MVTNVFVEFQAPAEANKLTVFEWPLSLDAGVFRLGALLGFMNDELFCSVIVADGVATTEQKSSKFSLREFAMQGRRVRAVIMNETDAEVSFKLKLRLQEIAT